MLIFGAVALVVASSYWMLHNVKLTVEAGDPKVRTTLRVLSVDGEADEVPPIHEEVQVASLREYMRMNIADADAEVLMLSEPVIYHGSVWRVMRFRSKNAFGGPVINEVLARFRGDDAVDMLKAEQFASWKGNTVEESKTFLRALAAAKPIDLPEQKYGSGSL